jgi:hypothetical protein
VNLRRERLASGVLGTADVWCASRFRELIARRRTNERPSWLEHGRVPQLAQTIRYRGEGEFMISGGSS